MIESRSESPSVCHGEQSEALQKLPSLPGILHQATQTTEQIVYLHLDGTPQQWSYSDLWQRSQRLLAGMQSRGVQGGDRIVLHQQNPLDLLAGIWACWLGGLVAVPIAVTPSFATEDQQAAQLRSVVEAVDAALVLTNAKIQPTVKDILRSDHVVDLESLSRDSLQSIGTIPSLTTEQTTVGDRLALILFTSGSTGTPKGVMLTEQNLMVSAYGMARVNGLTAHSITLNWMPLEHVASLVMFHLTQVFVGCRQIHVAKDYILQDPLRWLDLIDRFRVTATWAPNFAYGLINDRAPDIAHQQWNLSCLQWMGNGAEAVVAKTSRTFLQLLVPHGLSSKVISPGYGMSETCSGIVHSHEFGCDRTQDDDPYVEVGTPIPGVALRIVDEQQQILPQGTIGSLQVKGLTVTRGYYGQPEQTAEVFTPDGWFITGDLGFLKQGRLTITGRQKDVIILNGVNVYSHEIEAVVEELPQVEVSYTAACAVRRAGETTDRLAIFLHPAIADLDLRALIKAVRRQVATRLGMIPDYVIPVDRIVIPKTAIGKIQRSQLSQQFHAGKFDHRLAELAVLLQPSAAHEMPRNQIEQDLLEIWRSVLNLETVGLEEHFFELGGNSLQLVQVLHQLQQRGYRLSVTDLFQYSTITALAQFLSRDQDDQIALAPAVQQGQRRAQRRRPMTAGIAVVGMACRFPGAESIDQFWRNLCEGQESITFFSDEEILSSGIDLQVVRHPAYVKASPILQEVETFDSEFFGYSPREAELMDPQQRLMLECAWEALEDAGYDPFTYAETGGAIALYAGASMNTYLLNHVYPNRDRLDTNESLDTLTLSSMGGFQLTVANDKDYLTTRVSYKLNLTGSSVNVQTACSTSLVAIHMAAQALLAGECEMALAGGVSIHTPQKVGHLYQEGMILSPDGHCRAFDAQAQGTIFGSGAGIVVLKRLEEAIEDGDQIYAVIKGSASGNDGGMKVGYLAPRIEGQASVISEAMTMAGFSPESITYIEAHGTGTELGDPIEVAALTQAFRSQTTARQFCAIGSVKTNVGHLNIASGVVGFIKTALALHHRQIPPSLHFQTPNPRIDFASSPFFVNTALHSWESPHSPRRAGVNSLGIGGTNVHVFLEEAPPRPRRLSIAERPLHLLTLSAKSAVALQVLVDRYRQFLDDHPQVSLADLCFTANGGRSHFSHRLALVADSTTAMQAQLRDWQGTPQPPPPDTRPTLAFLFPGQGAQFPQMGQQLYETQPVFRQAIDRCDQILHDQGVQAELGGSLRALLYGAADSNPGHPLQQTLQAQPALFAVEYALFELWRSWGVQPDVVVGHSLGEYVAACVAGVFSLEDALRLVVGRARLMNQQPAGAMVAVFASVEQVRSVLTQTRSEVAIAVINSPDNTVIAGTPTAIQQAIAEFQRRGIQTQALPVSHAFHSPLMTPVLAEFRAIAQTVRYTPPTLPLISNLTGELADEEIASADYWCQQLRQPVQFATCLQHLQSLGSQIALECGPKPTLISLGQSLQGTTPQLWLPSLHPKQENWRSLLDSLKALYLQGVKIDWAGFDRPYSRQRLSLPTYPFQRQRHWLEARPPSRPSIPTTVSIHPLLGQKIATPRSTLFNQPLSLEALPFLRDHRVHGAIVFPGAAYLEMALAAAAQWWPDAVVGLNNVVIDQPMLLSEGVRSLQMSVTPEATGLAFEIHSRQSDTWTLHCRGVMVRDPSLQLGLELTQIQQHSAEAMVWDALRDSLTGLEYGARFQGVQQVWRSPQGALGLVQIPSCLRPQAHAYQIHPALLDACLQVILATVPDHSRPYIPVSLDQLQFNGGLSHRLWSSVVVKTQTPEVLIVDVAIFNDHGDRVLMINGLTARAVSARSLGMSPIWANWLHTLVWQAAPLPVIAPSSSAGHWLIFADRLGVGQQLAHSLEEQHQSSTLVFANRLFASGEAVCIDPLAPEAYDGVVQPLLQRRGALKGVVYLWGLEAKDGAATLETCTWALYLTQALIRAGGQVPLWLVTQGSQAPGIQLDGLAQAPLWGLGRTIALEHPALDCRCIDLEPACDQAVGGLVAELLAEVADRQVSGCGGDRRVAHLSPLSIATPTTPQTLQLHIVERGSLDQLVWRSHDRRDPAPHEIELRVLTAGLNFRDVLNALGRYPGEAGPLGLECVGEVVAVGTEVQGFAPGDRVIAIAPGCFGQFVKLRAELAIHLPSGLSIAAAATLPTAFLTAHYGLRELAKLKRGDRVLIHSAAGGVGMAAVQLAQQVGAEVFATASPTKWQPLQQMGVTHLYSSRSLDFVEAIWEDTQGAGLDVVLNALTGDWMLKSATLLRPQGCFVEIGKPDVEQFQVLQRVRPDIAYHRVDLMQVTEQHPDQIQTMLRRMVREVQQGQIQPLPHTQFPHTDIGDAFRYMQQAKQVGKVVIEFALPTFTVRPEGCYLIAGGLGGLGLAVAQALITWGAKHLVLVGRSAPSLTVERLLQQWRQSGVEVTTAQLDIAEAEAVTHFFQTRFPFPLQTLRGVFHTAGVLDDGAIDNQTRERLERVMAAKLQGAWNLHQATQGLPLDCFVLFSSAASLLGSAGQGNYAAANAGLDALSHLRRSLGLPSLSINWGPWADVGMSAHDPARFEKKGMVLIEPAIGVEILKALLSESMPQIGVLPFNGEATEAATTTTPCTEAEGELSWNEYLQPLPEAKRPAALADLIRQVVAKVLGVHPTSIAPDRGLSDLGMDSLTSTELSHQLQKWTEQSLPTTLLYNYPTLGRLTAYLAERMGLNPEQSATADLAEPLATVDPRVDPLSEAEAEALLLSELDRLNL